MNTLREIKAFLSHALQKGVFQQARENGEWTAFEQEQLIELLNIVYPPWRDYLDELSSATGIYDLVLDYRPRTKRMVARCSVHGGLPIIKHEDDRMQYDLTILDAWLHQRNHHGFEGLPEFDILANPDIWHDDIAFVMGAPLLTITTFQSDFR